MLGGQSRDAQIDRPAGDVFLNPAILRQTALRDVEVGHDLQPRDYRHGQMPRRRRHFVERPIHPVPNFEFGFERLEMNVGSPVLHRLIHDQIDVANDRRGIGFRLERFDIDFSVRPAILDAAKLGENIVHARDVRTVMFFDQILDLINRRDHQLDVAIERKTERLERLRVQRVGDRELDRLPFGAERKRLVQDREARRQQFEQLGRRIEPAQIDIIGAERIGDHLIKLFLRANPVIDHHFDERFAGMIDFVGDILRLSLIDEALFDEDIENLFNVHGSKIVREKKRA
jgi:hypothetical protein